jgi:hypothetical protein
MILLAESRGFAFAMVTLPTSYLARRYMGGARDRFRYVFIYCLGVGPFMLLYACIRWTVLPPWDTGLQQYVPRSSHGPLELIHSGFADQITMYIAIVVAAHALFISADLNGYVKLPSSGYGHRPFSKRL